MNLIGKKRKINLEGGEEEEGRDNKVTKIEKIDDYKLCIGYSGPIYAFQLDEERAMMKKMKAPRWDYMREIQTEIDHSDRSQMIHTILLLAHHYKLEFESICLGASLLDRFLASHKVARADNCLAIAFTCLMLASKFVDSQLYLSSKDFVLIRGVSEKQVLYMEKVICEHLNFDFWKPTTYTFLRKYLGIALEGKEFGDIQLDSLAFCFGEMSLLHYGSLAHAPSEIAAALVFLAFFTLDPNEHPWPLTLQKEIEMIPEDFLDCILSIHNWIISGKSEFGSIRAKYLEQQFKGVGMLEPIDHIPDDYFKRVDR